MFGCQLDLKKIIEKIESGIVEHAWNPNYPMAEGECYHEAKSSRIAWGNTPYWCLKDSNHFLKKFCSRA